MCVRLEIISFRCLLAVREHFVPDLEFLPIVRGANLQHHASVSREWHWLRLLIWSNNFGQDINWAKRQLCFELTLFFSFVGLQGYQERVYAPSKWVCTEHTAHSDDDDVTEVMFWKLFRYISGDNDRSTSFFPVLSRWKYI